MPYAGVVTDLATFAWLCDICVSREHRVLGLGTWLAGAVRDHLAPHRRVLLFTAEAHEIYARVGFGPLDGPHDRVMALTPQTPGPA
ncbi:GNAT family N-acetyltransferase [Streptomyces profundus]|uniref:GNAT family N-acetyltransferase n=1 Tax=Streptomyces profundus TaxID=2867410 RepID=UPI003CC8BB57|nr:GNAT family N-acetyltransferase [Streptomyces sp. MA3_2.13]